MTASSMQFAAFGVAPAPKGSLKGFYVKKKQAFKGRVVMVEDNKQTKPFRRAVMQAAQEEANRVNWKADDAPIKITAYFYMPRPKSVKRFAPSVKPDIDKLLRTLLDGMADAGLFPDDSRVIAIYAQKFYAENDSKVGCYVYVDKIVDTRAEI